MLVCYNMIVAVVPRLTWSGARMITSGGLCAIERTVPAARPSPAPQSMNIPCTDHDRHEFPVCM